jgi:peptidoglycan/xylan/chitin deacetylase (PgdA/CDA1 family)
MTVVAPLRSAAGRAKRIGLRRLARASTSGRPGTTALTYDDGPHPEVTPQVLDALAAAGAHATFFVVGARALEHPRILHRMRDEGHSVGTHTMGHLDLATAAWDDARREIEDGRAAVEGILGRPVPLFRPPKGHLSIRSAMLLRAPRWRTHLWDTDAYDWQPDATARSIADAALSTGLDGRVVLLHDTVRASVEATERILDAARARDLTAAALA